MLSYLSVVSDVPRIASQREISGICVSVLGGGLLLVGFVSVPVKDRFADSYDFACIRIFCPDLKNDVLTYVRVNENLELYLRFLEIEKDVVDALNTSAVVLVLLVDNV